MLNCWKNQQRDIQNGIKDFQVVGLILRTVFAGSEKSFIFVVFFTPQPLRSEPMSQDVPFVTRSEYILCPMMYHSECSGGGEVSFCPFLQELLSAKIDARKLKRRRKCHLGHSLSRLYFEASFCFLGFETTSHCPVDSVHWWTLCHRESFSAGCCFQLDFVFSPSEMNFWGRTCH